MKDWNNDLTAPRSAGGLWSWLTREFSGQTIDAYVPRAVLKSVAMKARGSAAFCMKPTAR